MTNLTKTQGDFLLKLARDTLTAHLSGKKSEKLKEHVPLLDEKRGVFVTLHTKDGHLRGCIGYPEPVEPLIKAVSECAIHAAASDPRFPKVTEPELKDLKIEITVLTVPEFLDAKHYAHYNFDIVLGDDGLIVEQGSHKGLLLPQVATEWGWNEKQFLEHTCEKAGLPKDAWKDVEKTKIYKFQGQIFKE
ncbi:MAG: TIGR00296 family protein [Candidatus Undinarchaeales archaeon]|jgi:hypothetical protein|nr:TIGR00296 family protein [Candidatus Undinarchaeales archaeon]